MRKKTDDAVSPVIGVMLMLVVTIVIAAVVAVFASGVGTDAEPAPAAVLTVVDIEGGNAQTIVTTGTHKKSTEFRTWWRGNTDEFKSQYNDDSDFYLRTLGIAIYEQRGYDEYLVGYDLSKDANGWIVPIDEGYVSGGEPGSITIKSNGGDALELAKLSVKISDKSGNLLAESVSSATSDTLTTGGTHTFELSKTLSEKKVNVVILYGEKHVILDKEVEL